MAMTGCAAAMDAAFPFLDLELRDTGRLDELNQRLELAQVHGFIPEMSAQAAGARYCGPSRSSAQR